MTKVYKVTLWDDNKTQESVEADSYAVSDGYLRFYSNQDGNYVDRGTFAQGTWLSCFLVGEAKSEH